MMEKLRFLGLDVHAETITVAVAEADGEVRSLGTIANREESIRKLIRKLGPVEHLRACYEAGPTGFVVYWQLTQLGVKCDVVAPSLVPKKPGDKVKTDRRGAVSPATGGSQAGSAAREASADQVPAPYGPASSVRSEGVDGTLRGVGPAGALD